MSLIQLDHDGPLAIVSIDSPPLNLFDEQLMDELSETVDRLLAACRPVATSSSNEPHAPTKNAVDDATPPRGLLVRAQGSVVSGGVDVHVFDGLSAQDASAMWVRLLDIVHRVEQLPLPTVFAAHSLCLTAAFELSLGCDILLAAESARFGLVETVVGLTPAMGGTQRLAERAGPARARELVMTGELYEAATLERWNVVNRVLPDEGFDEAARAFARRLADGPTCAHAATKAIVRAYLEAGGARGADEQVPRLAGDLFATEDLKRAVRSFLENGPGHATYEGR
jgi:enoyl-CoA hydratase